MEITGLTLFNPKSVPPQSLSVAGIFLLQKKIGKGAIVHHAKTSTNISVTPVKIIVNLMMLLKNFWPDFCLTC